jgi:hypothetical protein
VILCNGSTTVVLAVVDSDGVPKDISFLIRRCDMAKGGKGGGAVGGSGGKGGSGKGGGGKGGGGKGGKGKKGGGCGPGQVTLCFSPAVVSSVIAAFSSAVLSKGPSDGCLAGLMRVCLDTKTATQVWANLTVILGQGGPKKKKGKAGLTVGVPPKLKGGKPSAIVSNPRP